MSAAPPLIVADIGGTHARFAMMSAPHERHNIKILKTAEWPSFEAALSEFLRGVTVTPPLRLATGAAGAVRNGRVTLTNAGWTIDRAALLARGDIQEAVLVNDMVAFGAGVAVAPRSMLTMFREGARSGEATAVITVGTGLGSAAIRIIGGKPVILASEAGHMQFAPSTEDEARLAAALARRDGHPMPWEGFISGTAFPALTVALGGDPARARHIALTALGSFARNFIHAMAGAGHLVLGGGFLSADLPALGASDFLARLTEGPRMPLDLSGIAVSIAEDGLIALDGLAALAEGRAIAA